jgi:hypothetical protein
MHISTRPARPPTPPVATPGAKVLDLGCVPGAWLQVACQQLGPRDRGGLVLGVDLQEVKVPARWVGGRAVRARARARVCVCVCARACERVCLELVCSCVCWWPSGCAGLLRGVLRGVRHNRGVG